MTLSAHQPNFVPWMPYFQKMERSDVFVILGHVQYEKGNYQNRFRADQNWFTMSVRHGNWLMKDKIYTTPARDWEVIKRSYPKLWAFDHHISTSLWATNKGIIEQAATILGIKTKIVSDYPTDLKSTARLVDLCKTFGADTYLAGSGASKMYLDETLFHKEGINVIYQEQNEMNRTPLMEHL